MKTELMKFINKKLKYHEQKRIEAEENYQETGKTSTYNTMINHEYYYDALLQALDTVNDMDKGFERHQRHIQYIKQKANEISENFPAEEALRLILKEIDGLSYFANESEVKK